MKNGKKPIARNFEVSSQWVVSTSEASASGAHELGARGAPSCGAAPGKF